jgi:hypothetical protein
MLGIFMALSNHHAEQRELHTAGITHVATHSHKGVDGVCIICVSLARCFVLLDALDKLIKLHQATAIVIHLQ